MCNRRCDKCEWWVRNKNKPRPETKEDDAPFDFYQEKDETYGQCRMNPPSVPMVEADSAYLSVFPVTHEDCWCGKFEAKK